MHLFRARSSVLLIKCFYIPIALPMPVDVAHFDRLYPAIVIDTRNVVRISRSNANLVTEINRDGYITGARVVLYERRMRKRNGHVALNYNGKFNFRLLYRGCRFFSSRFIRPRVCFYFANKCNEHDTRECH